jgi:hypothetical protein
MGQLHLLLCSDKRATPLDPFHLPVGDEFGDRLSDGGAGRSERRGEVALDRERLPRLQVSDQPNDTLA